MSSRQELQSWAFVSSPADFFRGTPHASRPEGSTRRPGRRDRFTKSSSFLRRLARPGAQKKHRRQTCSGNLDDWFDGFTEDEELDSENEDASSFVASRSNSVFSNAPVLCPPIPANDDRSVENSSFDPCNSSTSPIQTNSCAATSLGVAEPEDTSTEMDVSYIPPMRKNSSVSSVDIREIYHHQDESTEAAGESSRPVHETRNVPYLETLSDCSSFSQTSFNEEDLFASVQSYVMGVRQEQVDCSYEIEVFEEGRRVKATKPRSKNRSLTLSGDVMVCPEEGILTLEPQLSVHQSVRDVRDHRETRKEFRKASADGKKLTQRALSWALRYVKKNPLQGVLSWIPAPRPKPAKRRFIRTVFR